MNEKGIVFDIKELAVFDGPGLRVTVFFKGCPLRCQWCHNPEGISFKPQLMASPNGCLHCGKCDAVCPSLNHCTACGKCVTVCPRGLRRVAGTTYTAEVLAEKLLRNADYLKANDGGFTFSGGEPTAQPAFLLALLKWLRGNHRAIETSGYCNPSIFKQILAEVELVMMDLKAIDTEIHRKYTGVDNDLILENLQQLKASGVPFIIRIPVIPGVNDHPDNMAQTAVLLTDCPSLIRVELLPYHVTAGAKYSMVGLDYKPNFDVIAEPNLSTHEFEKRGVICQVI
ncbi:MAG: glycyl-radical enzyme activating protein [Eubacteriales bacterium]|nr:glycyl-radical enzyme activating protein [Eubacteriales bacterium]